MDDANKISQSNESLQVTQRSRVGFISSKIVGKVVGDVVEKSK
jgi:hypothetical protein